MEETRYDPHKIEERWRDYWEKNSGIYAFDPEDRRRPKYFINTPPPYPTGEFHLGHALNWVYMDVIARFKRMRGYNVLFPQGWDCHGLPTEVKVEEIYGITKRDVPRDKFRKLCEELTARNIARMKEQIKMLGISIDWNYEYITMTDDYKRKSQLSFLILYKRGLIYRTEHPVNWCPRCETAIADAEVEYSSRRGYLYYIKFRIVDSDGDYATIATTRPELLPACVAVAVHPEDSRYRHLIGKELEVPLFGRKVPVLADRDVDPEFGTGIVMICTFGDKQDVRWAKRYNLPIIRAIDETGRLTEAAGRYKGLKVEEAREKIVEDLEKSGLLERKEEISQNVGVCWRCKTPIEILSKVQWFANIRDLKDKFLEKLRETRWFPEYMRIRLIDWLNSLEWDWCISRQRIFATPIPVWYCGDCGEVIPAREDMLPVDPPLQDPPVERCPRCGSANIIPESDVLDTWWDSSQTALYVAGWPDTDSDFFKWVYPADLQPNGHDIIRTWDFYLHWKSVALLGIPQYRDVLINGMIYGEDGRKMSKSLGNIVLPDEIIEKYGADTLRNWAIIAGTPGSDVQFFWKDVVFCYRFLNKLWNASRFVLMALEKGEESKKNLRAVDLWILSKLRRLVEEVTDDLESYAMNRALSKIIKFVWEDFCDEYIEIVKHRVYGDDPTRGEALYTLRKVLEVILKILAPFSPFITEEIYHKLNPRSLSIHSENWPDPADIEYDERSLRAGEIAKKILGELRKFKSERKLSLADPISYLGIYSQDGDERSLLELVSEDIERAMRIRKLEILNRKPEIKERVTRIHLDPAKIGPEFRELARVILERVSELDQESLGREILEKGRVEIDLGDGRKVILRRDHVKRLDFERIAGEERVDVRSIGNITLIIGI